MKTKFFSTLTSMIMIAGVLLCSGLPAFALASMDSGSNGASINAESPSIQCQMVSAGDVAPDVAVAPDYTQFAVGVGVVLTVGAIVAGSMLSLNSAYVPTPQDEASRLESSATKTATFNGTSYDQGAGFAPGGIGMPAAAVVNITAIDRTTGDETYSWVLEESSDNSTFTAAGAAVSVTAVGVFSVPGFISKRYVRVKPTLAGTTPSVTYEAWLNTNVV